ncbi:MAG: carbohydrate ABC transporter permease, partial [Pseudomonadota bacterium]
MENIVGQKPALRWAVHAALLALVLLWVFPTAGLLVSSFRTSDQISGSGWWQSMLPQEQNRTLRAKAPDTQTVENGLHVIEGNLFDAPATITAWGVSSRAIADYAPGDTASLRKGGTVTLARRTGYPLSRAGRFQPFGCREPWPAGC